MSDLKEKAFYVWFEPKDIKKEPRKVCQGNSCPLYDDAWGTMHCGYFGGGWCGHLEYGQVYDKLLVTFEDAQKEIDSLEKQIEKEIMIRCGYSEQIVELKRKLQKWFDKYRVEWIKCPKHLTCTQCKDAHYCEFQNIVKEFEQLLKENQRVERK
jgi:hypothetical protein